MTPLALPGDVPTEATSPATHLLERPVDGALAALVLAIAGAARPLPND